MLPPRRSEIRTRRPGSVRFSGETTMERAFASEAIRFDALEPRLQTGDVFLFHGASRRSHAIEDVTRSEFSHVGMVLRPAPGRPALIWHTDPRPVAEDLDDSREHGGAQLNDLGAALAVMTRANYGDTPYVRQLLVERGADFERRALEAIAAFDETPFPSLLKVVQEWVLGHLHVATSERRMYCAEVLAATYQRMGLLPDHPPANDYSPRDFSAEHQRLPLLGNARRIRSEEPRLNSSH